MAPRPHTAFVVSNFDQEIFRKRPTVHLSSEKANSARFAMSPIPLHGRLFHIRGNISKLCCIDKYFLHIFALTLFILLIAQLSCYSYSCHCSCLGWKMTYFTSLLSIVSLYMSYFNLLHIFKWSWSFKFNTLYRIVNRRVRVGRCLFNLRHQFYLPVPLWEGHLPSFFKCWWICTTVARTWWKLDSLVS